MSPAESVFGAAITAFSPLKLVSQNSTAEKRLSFASAIFKRSALLGANVTTETKWVLRRIAAIFSAVGRRDRYEYKAKFSESRVSSSLYSAQAPDQPLLACPYLLEQATVRILITQIQ